MNRVDRYILSKFLGNFALFMGLIMLIAMVFDVSQKLDDFMDNDLNLATILLDYYLNFIAFYGNTFSALILFLSTVFFTARMANQGEISAMLTGGLSFGRLMRPYLIGAAVICLASASLSHFIIPGTNSSRIAFEEAYIQHRVTSRPIHLHRQVLPGHFIYVETWSPDRMGGYNFTYEHFEQGRMVDRLKASFIKYDSAKTSWHMDNWTLRQWQSNGHMSLTSGVRLDSSFAFLPQQFSSNNRGIETMTSPELYKALKQVRLSGSEAVLFYEMEWYRRSAYPLSAFILVLIAAAMASRSQRGGIGAQIALGLLVAVLYIFLMQLSSTLASTHVTSPLVAVWVPNILFLGVAMLAYRRASS
ncbi:MAG: LptF/LptG family permease [Flavobacteriales bacterium]|jgi:lipopolysaccharide export system permease protein|uniref:Predicted permease YjgP/YjgQ family superfamily n=1 Tax=uncultured marine bacterium Ant39E11 TaxID=360427 RepID=Q2PY37_9BACT|nr:predicted permease YjgP/YjgQ family superfamily [uncultured marine bacterium Ant39E11]MDE0791853.1 LptF/LptG family permease [Schleiferiaceae bacterium]|tara:strand:- start:5792 stop:6871 length:1080 start_codon:yes stop_codon:yes gene_type:complete